MKTLEVINKNNDTTKFAEHFKTKSSIKNLLKKVPNAKDVAKLFEDAKYGKEILGYSNLTDQFDIILSDAFTTYTAKVLTWRATGDNRPLSARVELFRDLVTDRMKKTPGTEIAGTLGDFMKSSTGKDIEKVLTEAGVKEDQDLYLNIIIMIATRAFINSIMVEEPVVVNACHTIASKKPDEEVTSIINVPSFEPKLPKGVQKILEMVDDMDAKVSDDEIRRFAFIVKPYVPDILKVLYTTLDKYTMTDEIWRSSTVQRIIKDLGRSDNLDNKMKKLLAFVADDKYDSNCSVILRNLFFIIIDVINHSDDDEHLYQDIKFIIRMIKIEGNYDGFLEETINQANRINGIINELNSSRTVNKPTPVSNPTPVPVPHVVNTTTSTNNRPCSSATKSGLDLLTFSIGDAAVRAVN